MPGLLRQLCSMLALLVLAGTGISQPPAPQPHPALDAYQAWLATDQAKHLRAVIIRGPDAAEAERIAALLQARGFTALTIQRTDLPTVDLSQADLFIVTRDTHSGVWSKPWGTDNEARALTTADKPFIAIGEGGVVCFGRFNLPVRGGNTMRSSGDSIKLGAGRHAVFAAPHALAADEKGSIKVLSRKLTNVPAHRSSFAEGVIPLCTDATAGQDYAPLLFQGRNAVYWGFDASFADLTDAGKDLFENTARWAVWASRQRDPSLLREGVVARPSPQRRGDRAVEITLTRCDGSPAKNTAFTVEVMDPAKGKGWTALTTGKTDDAAHAVIEGLTGGPDAEQYRVMVASATTPALSLRLNDGPARRELSARIPPLVGDIAPELPLIDLATNKPAHLSDYRGKIVFIDFWATWCVPCQEPMIHNNELMRTHADDWANRAVILGLSTDADRAALDKHIGARAWTAMPQLWIPREDAKAAVNAGEVFGFSGIPTGFLLDRRGVIRWRGHPAAIQVDAEIEKLLAEPAPHALPAAK